MSDGLMGKLFDVVEAHEFAGSPDAASEDLVATI